MIEQNDGGPAFPCPGFNGGMSLRDWFAGQALVGLLANQGAPVAYISRELGGSYDEQRRQADLATARRCLELADAMLEAGKEVVK